MESNIQDTILQLVSSQSPKRRSAAKKLRRLGVIEAGPALLAALEKEVKDPRTWETQYQLIMALGECNYVAALSVLERLAETEIEATMVYVGLGDAIVRLSRSNQNDAMPILKIVNHSKNTMLIDGALRAMAMLRMVPVPEMVRQVLAFVKPLGSTDPLRFWVAAAAPGWKHPDLEAFLASCASSSRQDIAEAGKCEQLKKYQKWSPL